MGQTPINGSGYESLIQRALDGLREIEMKEANELTAMLDLQSPMLFAIPVTGGSKFITRDGFSALQELGRTWYKNDPSLSERISQKAAEEQSVYAFGDIIGSSGEVLHSKLSDSSWVRAQLLRNLANRLTAGSRREHFYFPVRAFEHPDVEELTVGPVKFLRPAAWLDQVERISGQPVAWKSEIVERWKHSFSASESTYWELQHGAGSQHLTLEREDVSKFVGSSDWIASVTIEGRDRSRSQECAMVAVLVALDSLALDMSSKEAANLRGPGDSLETRMHQSLSQFDGCGLNKAVAYDIPRIGGRPGTQVAYLHDTRRLRAAVGEALTAFVDFSPSTSVPDMMRRWVEAMYWFGQARREQNGFIALVKNGITLDVLANGGKAKGIIALSCALFCQPEHEAITTDGVPLGAFIAKLYNEGRSRIAHGGQFAILKELPLDLSLVDAFTRQILIGYVACLSQYNGEDSYHSFLAEIPFIPPKLERPIPHNFM